LGRIKPGLTPASKQHFVLFEILHFKSFTGTGCGIVWHITVSEYTALPSKYKITTRPREAINFVEYPGILGRQLVE
jgi:hypothetical protein